MYFQENLGRLSSTIPESVATAPKNALKAAQRMAEFEASVLEETLITLSKPNRCPSRAQEEFTFETSAIKRVKTLEEMSISLARDLRETEVSMRWVPKIVRALLCS